MKITTTIKPTPSDYDSDNVVWTDEENKEHGYGFKSKENGVIHIVRCPMCDNENYMAQPICIKCGFSPNPEGEK